MKFFGNKENYSNIKLFYHIIENNYSEAFKILKNIWDGKEIPDDYYFLMGCILRKLNDNSAALQIQKNLLSAGKVNEKYLLIYEIVENLINQGETKEAVDLINDFLRKEEDEKLKRILPQLFYSLEEFELAAEYFKKNDDYISASYCYYRKALKLKDGDDYKGYLLKAIKYNDKLRSPKIDLSGYYFRVGKNGKALDLLIEIIYKDLVRSIDDIYYIKDKFKTFADLTQFENLINKRVNDMSGNPFYYVYLSEEAYLKGENEQSRNILINYTDNHNVSKIILKQYAKLINDPFFNNILMDEHLYGCENCRSTYKNFFSICPSCGLVDTISPL